MLKRGLAKNGEGVGGAQLDICLRAEAILVDQRVAAPGRTEADPAIELSISCPLSRGSVQAPAKAPTALALHLRSRDFLTRSRQGKPIPPYVKIESMPLTGKT
jgi:hypothetical protein